MKPKFLTIQFRTTKMIVNDVNDAIDGKIKIKNSKRDQMLFDKVDTFRSILTINRYHLLVAIARNRPTSIYALAKVLSRDYAHVFRDCKTLENFRFIKIHQDSDDRSKATPSLAFNYDIILVKSKPDLVLPVSENAISSILGKAFLLQ